LKISAAAAFTQPLESNFIVNRAIARLTLGLLPCTAARCRFAASRSLRPWFGGLCFSVSKIFTRPPSKLAKTAAMP